MMHSIEVSTENVSVLASTLANGGVCPLTGRSVLQPVTVRNTLSLMHSCGMGAESGEFSFKVGIPAKYSRTGAVMLVVPGMIGACFHSPGVNHKDLPIRAKHFFTKLSEVYSFHPFESSVRQRGRVVPPGDAGADRGCLPQHARVSLPVAAGHSDHPRLALYLPPFLFLCGRHFSA